MIRSRMRNLLLVMGRTDQTRRELIQMSSLIQTKTTTNHLRMVVEQTRNPVVMIHRRLEMRENHLQIRKMTR